ncbi:MAG TPA: hypothetical protein VMU84_00725 [Thermoanaerobaculia bacterium]|nr:hypothetical protein [Thermoanaerobaculia bacterium]
MRERLQKAVIVTASLLLPLALIQRFYERRPPYFAAPRTIVDHVDRIEHSQRQTILLLDEVRPLIPRGAQVTCFRVINGKRESDNSNYLTAVGQLPHHVVLPPFAADSLSKSEVVEYVVAIGEPFNSPAYKVIAGFPEGFLYRADR